MKTHKDLLVWQKSIDLVTAMYKLTNGFPSNEIYGLTSQLRRASVSIPSNIVEGCSRNSEIEFKRYLEIAMGSIFEVETQLIIAKELDFIKSEELTIIFSLIETEVIMINSLVQKIKNS